MGIRKIPPFDAHWGLMRKESLDEIIYRKMVLIISSCWFHFTNFLFFLTKFIAHHVFRIKVEDSPETLMKEFPKRLETVSEATELEERDFDEKEPSSFSFKFQYQIPDFNARSNEEPEISTTTTNISNYQFLSEKDFSGFVEEPKGMTFHVHESFIGSFEENTETKFLSAEVFQQPNVESRGVMLLKDDASGFIEENEEPKFLSEKDEVSSGFVEEPKGMTFHDHESSIGSFEENMETKFLSAEVFQQLPNLESGDIMILKENRQPKFLSGKDDEQCKKEFRDVILLKDQLLEEKSISYATSSLGEREVTEGFSGFDSDSESMSFSDGYSVKDLMVDTDSDGFLSERDFGEKNTLANSYRLREDGFSKIKNQTYGNFYDGFLPERDFNKQEKKLVGQIDELQSFEEEKHSSSIGKPFDRVSQSDETWSENNSCEPELNLKELDVGEGKESHLPSSSGLPIELVDSSDDELSFFRNDGNNLDTEPKPEDLDSDTELDASSGNILNPTNGSNQVDEVLGKGIEGLTCKPEDLEAEKSAPEEDKKKSNETQPDELDDEELDELESLWEHQDLIEQLRMELKKVRAVGLPTILEESESPKTIEDLKPWKIDEKFLQEDPMDELQKFYKSYRERMRKFDILNYQKMYAIGFLQLKDPLQWMGSQKPLIPTIKSHLSQNLLPFFRRKPSNDPSEKFIKELQSDLETVYVGQTCLSWEFLHWQYEKARELPDSDPYRSRQYNQVAGEFQQFQVIMQRFIENESFQGPRLPNYVKNRCVLRNLLQVPVIKEDCLKDKMEEQKKGSYVVTSEILEEIMEESIRIFWEFVKADKDETPTILKGLITNQVELQDPSDFYLMEDIQANLQKKEKKLKDIQRTGNCIVKKFKKPREDRSNQDLFFSQVDMKLVSRVLKMSRITTDQLVWCHKKMSKITFAERKIHREPSFLLFPC